MYFNNYHVLSTNSNRFYRRWNTSFFFIKKKKENLYLSYDAFLSQWNLNSSLNIKGFVGQSFPFSTHDLQSRDVCLKVMCLNGDVKLRMHL